MLLQAQADLLHLLIPDEWVIDPWSVSLAFAFAFAVEARRGALA